MFSRQDLDEIDFQSIAREVKEFGEWNLYCYVNLMIFMWFLFFQILFLLYLLQMKFLNLTVNRHKLKWTRPTCPKSFGPLSPNIHIQILQTDLGTFP